MTDPHFREALADLLSRLDVNTLEESVPVVYKAGSKTTEVRDTVHPKLVTEMLTGFLRGIGKPLNVVRLHKRTRDDVLWNSTFKPWRRSPLWLLLRIVLQSTLVDNTRYKSFMIFFMARLLEQATEANHASDILFVMAAKIGRRALKLNLSEDEVPWVKYVHEIVAKTHSELSRRWNDLQNNVDPSGLQKLWCQSDRCFERDTKLSLDSLRPYLAGIWTRSNLPADSTVYNPRHIARVGQNSSLPPIGSPSSSNQDYDLRLWLLDVERWVRNCLPSWINIQSHLTSRDTCTLLSDLISDYDIVATSAYAGNPEDVSMMLLTTLELWVALDICAVHQVPLLKRYKPGFPEALFDPLLLPEKVQMERLSRVEAYIQSRTAGAAHSSSLIFQDVTARYSLAVQYFEQSENHQMLHQTIENAALAERTRKKQEIEDKKKKYHQLIQESNSKVCEKNGREWNNYTNEYYSTHVSSQCQKCLLKTQADHIQIKVHEWPLPRASLEAKSAVFELDVPEVIARWRDTTYTLLVDVFSPQRTERCGDSNKYLLKDYTGLIGYVRGQMGRLQLASQTKSFMVAHYRAKPISQATVANICVNNGLTHSLYDSKSKVWTHGLLDRCNVEKVCTLQLPPGTYESLQWALSDTTHTSNETLARQSECPRGLDLHQFYSFGVLRSGCSLQWRNIARELVARILNFNHEEVYMLVIQAAWQAGPASTKPCRKSHTDLEEEEFGITLALGLEDALNTVEGNWQGAGAVKLLSTIATRLLSVSPHSAVHNRCYQFLRRARTVATAWLREVGQLMHDGHQAEEELTTLNLRALELALLCHATYHVGQNHIPELLRSSEDVAVIIECCIVIRDRCPAETGNLPGHLKSMLRRSENLAHTVEQELSLLILKDREGIDNTIRRVWAGYQSGSTWSKLKEPNERWVTTKMSSESGASSMTVHYNILDGTLLVDGSKLTRLPPSYEMHHTYKRLFGEVNFSFILNVLSKLICFSESLGCYPILDERDGNGV